MFVGVDAVNDGLAVQLVTEVAGDGGVVGTDITHQPTRIYFPDQVVGVFDEEAVTFLVFAQSVLGGLAGGDILHNDEQAVLPSNSMRQKDISTVRVDPAGTCTCSCRSMVWLAPPKRASAMKRRR